MEIIVKNMVCNRCIKVIKEELIKNNIGFIDIALGKIKILSDTFNNNKEELKLILNNEGFELVEDRDARMVNQVKMLIIENIHHQKEKSSNQNFSDFIRQHFTFDYAYISKLFSEIESKTIEHFTIEQKIERAKELLVYDELTLSQISYDLNYSSPQHLSRQFKQITGLTPTEFKKIGKRKKLDTI